MRGDAAVVPDAPGRTPLAGEVLRQMHDSPMYGHLGTAKTLKAVERSYWWPRLGLDVRGYVRACDACLRHSRNRRGPPACRSRYLCPLPPGRA